MNKTGRRRSVTRVLDAWDAARGQSRPDGRTRRAGLAVTHTDPPAYRQLADRVKELADDAMSFGAIADELEVDRNTVTAAWRHWHESRGLPVPDGRARRKELRLAAAGAPSGPQAAESMEAAPTQVAAEPEPSHTTPPPAS